MTGHRTACVAACVAAMALGATASAQVAAPPADPQTVVLSMVGQLAGVLRPEGPVRPRRRRSSSREGAEVDTPAPPAGWREGGIRRRARGSGFAASLACRTCTAGPAREPTRGSRYLDDSSTFQSLICLRGRLRRDGPGRRRRTWRSTSSTAAGSSST